MPTEVWYNGLVQTQLEELADNKVRLTIEVPSDDLRHAVEHAASDLAQQAKIPGFRQGKVPMPVLLSRVGKERLYAEAVESHIGGWFWAAASREGLRPTSQPDFDFELPTTEAEGWTFTATVDVQPQPELPDWTTLEVPRAETAVPEELVEAELDALRATVAELSPVDGRPAQAGDVAVVDLVDPEGEGGQRDYVVEIGSGRLVEEIERSLVGMSAGESGSVEFELADDSRRSVEVSLKELRERVLPPLDDELARTTSEFDTLAELRADVETRLRDQLEAEAEGAFRAAAVDRLVEATRVEPQGPIVDARTRELLNGLVRSVERRGVDFESYLALTGQRAEELVARLQDEAQRSVAREIVLEALAERLGLEVADEEIVELIAEEAEAAGEDPRPIVEELFRHGGDRRLRTDLRLRKAVDRLAADVRPISPELAEARQAIWTPEQEKAAAETKLWTPGSKE
ncbi:MAG: trigger factor [Thermoleophilia bacterium]|nr:trigger factor [Thermoleophilia bacterium]